MHPHTRRITNKQFTRFPPPTDSAAQTAAPVAPRENLEVHEDELSHLAKDLAYFRAERYREVNSEDVRNEDIRQAEAEIAAMFRHDDTAWLSLQSRRQAGSLLAQALLHHAGVGNVGDVIVLALPRGGVPVAFEVAGALKAPLDLMLARKRGTPGQAELAMGAIAQKGGGVC